MNKSLKNFYWRIIEIYICRKKCLKAKFINYQALILSISLSAKKMTILS